jgi:hypothetical protein
MLFLSVTSSPAVARKVDKGAVLVVSRVLEGMALMQRESKLLSLGVCADVSQIPDNIRPENVHVCVVRVSPRQIAGDDISGREKLNAHRRRNVGRATTITNQGFHRFTTEEGVWRARVHEEEHVMPRSWALGTRGRVTLAVATANQVDHVAIVRGDEHATQSLLRLQVVTDDLLGQVDLPKESTDPAVKASRSDISQENILLLGGNVVRVIVHE